MDRGLGYLGKRVRVPVKRMPCAKQKLIISICDELRYILKGFWTRAGSGRPESIISCRCVTL